MTITIDKHTEAELAELARNSGRTPADLVAEALASYLAAERWFATSVRAGLADLEASRLVDHDAVVASVRQALRPNA